MESPEGACPGNKAILYISLKQIGDLGPTQENFKSKAQMEHKDL